MPLPTAVEMANFAKQRALRELMGGKPATASSATEAVRRMASTGHARRMHPDSDMVRNIVMAEIGALDTKIEARIGALDTKMGELSTSIQELLVEMRQRADV